MKPLKGHGGKTAGKKMSLPGFGTIQTNIRIYKNLNDLILKAIPNIFLDAYKT